MDTGNGIFAFFVAVMASVLGAAVWAALDPSGQNPLAHIAIRVGVSPSGWGYAAIVAGAYALSLLVWLRTDPDANSEGTPNTKTFFGSVATVLIITTMAVLALAIPVGVLVAVRVVAGADPESMLTTLLAYLPLGAAAIGIASVTWMPIAWVVYHANQDAAQARRSLSELHKEVERLRRRLAEHEGQPAGEGSTTS